MKRFFLLVALLFCVAGCAEVELASHLTKQVLPPSKTQGTFKVGSPYKIDGQRYFPHESYDLVETGIASWYGSQFHGKTTANGETFDKNELTAAHRTLQMPSLVRVTNLENGRSLVVRVNDRGPYKRGRIIDLSERAAELLGYKSQGTAKVRLEVLREESLQIAQAAKNGLDTSGYEIALNRTGHMPAPPASALAMAPMPQYEVPALQPASGGDVPEPAAVSRELLVTPPKDGAAFAHAIPGHTKNGAFYPDPVVTEIPVTRTDIFVQAGSFSMPENAYRLSTNLKRLARVDVYPAIVNGRQFYRVRLGPVSSVAEADDLLARLVSTGHDSALIVVE